jgi:hypothetical protein
MGILLITNNEKIIFRLIDNYRLPFFQQFKDDYESIVHFSSALKKYLDDYNNHNHNIIKFHVPTKWRYAPRLLLTISAILSLFILMLWIFVYLVPKLSR